MTIERTEPGCKYPEDKFLRSRRCAARETSIAAFESQDDETMCYRHNRIYGFIKERGGATCWEVEQAFGGLHQTISAAISNMCAKGTLVDSGARRPTATGRKAIVWRVA
jgi:hypothetical protein